MAFGSQLPGFVEADVDPGTLHHGDELSEHVGDEGEGVRIGGVEGHGRTPDPEDPFEPVRGDGQGPVAIVTEPPFEVPEGVLVGHQLDTP